MNDECVNCRTGLPAPSSGLRRHEAASARRRVASFAGRVAASAASAFFRRGQPFFRTARRCARSDTPAETAAGLTAVAAREELGPPVKPDQTRSSPIKPGSASSGLIELDPPRSRSIKPDQGGETGGGAWEAGELKIEFCRLLFPQ